MVEVKWSTQSLIDIDHIAEYIANDSIKYAEHIVFEIFLSTDILKNFPKSGRIVPELRNKRMRELLVGPYRIIYHINNPNLINIITIHHAKRQLKPRILKKNI
jgi:toxin ParE1/3/4